MESGSARVEGRAAERSEGIGRREGELEVEDGEPGTEADGRSLGVVVVDEREGEDEVMNEDDDVNVEEEEEEVVESGTRPRRRAAVRTWRERVAPTEASEALLLSEACSSCIALLRQDWMMKTM